MKTRNNGSKLEPHRRKGLRTFLCRQSILYCRIIKLLYGLNILGTSMHPPHMTHTWKGSSINDVIKQITITKLSPHVNGRKILENDRTAAESWVAWIWTVKILNTRSSATLLPYPPNVNPLLSTIMRSQTIINFLLASWYFPSAQHWYAIQTEAISRKLKTSENIIDRLYFDVKLTEIIEVFWGPSIHKLLHQFNIKPHHLWLNWLH